MRKMMVWFGENIDPLMSWLYCQNYMKVQWIISCSNILNSCEISLLKAVDDWKYELDENRTTGVVIMDLSKAFDCQATHYWLPNIMQRNHKQLKNRKLQGTRAYNYQTGTSAPRPYFRIFVVWHDIFINDLLFFISNCTLYNYADVNLKNLTKMYMFYTYSVPVRKPPVRSDISI